MTILSGLGIVLSLVFGCLLLALVGELYYLLWWKKQRIINTPPNNTIQQDYSTHAKEMFYLFCWDKPTKNITNPNTTNPIGTNPDENHPDPDIEMGLGLDPTKDLLLKALGEEVMDQFNSRFLFTIKEETKEDFESDDGKSSKGDKSRTRSLSDLIMAIESSSPSNLKGYNCSSNLVKKKNNYNNPLFESSIEAEINKFRSSPPPKFKFLRDAEEKLFRKLLMEAQKIERGGVFQHEGILDNSLDQQVLSLASSPKFNVLSNNIS